MKACLDRTGTVEGLERVLYEASVRPGARGILLLTCDANHYEPLTIDPVLKRTRLPVAGAVFPAVFAKTELLELGSIAVSLPSAPRVLACGGDRSDEADITKSLMESGLGNHPTMLVLTDGLASNPTAILDALFDVFGLEITYLGGGAGSLTLQQRPCLITNEGLVRGGSVVVGLDLACGIGVGHGHAKVAGPHQITAASGRLVRSIDWHPAASYYRHLIQQRLRPGEDDTGGVVSRNFCLAMNRLDGEFVVREAVRVLDDDSLEFAAEMPEGELVDVVRADRAGMLAAATEARQEAQKNLSAPLRTNLCFTCCARRIFLQDDFEKELQALDSGEVPLFGAITVGGEIGNNGDRYLDYYNRTCVVGAFEV